MLESRLPGKGRGGVEVGELAGAWQRVGGVVYVYVYILGESMLIFCLGCVVLELLLPTFEVGEL